MDPILSREGKPTPWSTSVKFFMSYVGVALSELGKKQEELGWGGSLQLSGSLSQVITKIPSELRIYCC